MANKMRDRFVELFLAADTYDGYECLFCDGNKSCGRCHAEKIADHFIENNATLLPCKVGDTIYVVFSQFKSDIMECKVDEISVQKDGVYVIVDLHYPNYVAYRNTAIPEWWFGRYAFFTKEEAEQKLKEMRGE